ncbi:MAG TPA: hypothetical protein DIW64_14710 [Cellvibrio sp.]|nr:hypothetical protein [Cellvibrio sp.]
MALNGKKISQGDVPSTYLSVKRKWKKGDVISLTLSPSLRLERAKDAPSMVSIFYGPVLLAGELGTDNMPNDLDDKDTHLKVPAVRVPDIASSSTNPVDWLQLITQGDKLALSTQNVVSSKRKKGL